MEVNGHRLPTSELCENGRKEWAIGKKTKPKTFTD